MIKELNNKKRLVCRWEYLMVLLMMFMSGNPWWRFAVTEYTYIIFAIILFFIYNKKIRTYQRGILFKRMVAYFLVIIFIFICQTVIFGWNTFPGIINYCAKMFIGFTIYIVLGSRFKHVYLRLLYRISIFCIICWILKISVWPDIGIVDYISGKSMIFFNHRYNEPIRNCGFFWEPGAYGCYILLVPIFFFNQLENLWNYYRKECIVLIIALLSTQSTTAYMSLALLLGIYMFFKMKSRIKYLLILVFASFSYYVYISLDFLKEKIDYQTTNSIENVSEGNWSSHRLGSMLFDLEYIQKHPIVGNGLHEKTNWKDHPWIWEDIQNGDLSKSGNGLSGWVRQFGFLGILVFSFVFYRNNLYESSKNILFVLILLFLILLGEPLYIYPIFIGVPFLSLNKNKINFTI